MTPPALPTYTPIEEAARWLGLSICITWLTCLTDITAYNTGTNRMGAPLTQAVRALSGEGVPLGGDFVL